MIGKTKKKTTSTLKKIGGEEEDPKKKKVSEAKQVAKETSERYVPQNPKSTADQNAYRAQENLARVRKYTSDTTVGNKSTKTVYDPQAGAQTSRSVSSAELAKRDSVSASSKEYLAREGWVFENRKWVKKKKGS